MSVLNTLKFLVNHPLNRSNKLSAIAQYLKWRIGSRLVPGEVVFHWVNNSKIFARAGEDGIDASIYCGLQEFSDMAFLLHVLRSEDLFVDIGANIGSYTVLACSAIGARGYAFEPVPSTFSRLMNNIRLNNIEDKVTCLNIGLGNTIGEIYFSSDTNTINHVVAENELVENKIMVNVSTLDEALKADPFLIKIDVEGYELPVLEGAEHTLRNEELCSVVMELNGSGDRYGFEETKIVQMMFDYGFEAYAYRPFERALVVLQGKNFSPGNTLFIRNRARVLERVKSAAKIEVHGTSI